jgi:rhomboid family GlyGly-CTERM serine protease
MPTNSRLPVTTLTVVGLAVIVSASPVLARWLVWDRAAIAGGQWWRLLTGHLVHFTPQHLGLDALAVVTAGWLIENLTRQSWALLSVMTALAISLIVFVFCPTVHVYGGLSGVACAMYGYLALLGICAGARARWIGLAMLALLAGKIGGEILTGQSLFISDTGDSYVVLSLAHTTGLVAGALAGVAATGQPVEETGYECA